MSSASSNNGMGLAADRPTLDRVERTGDDGCEAAAFRLAEATCLEQLVGLGPAEPGVERLGLHDAARRSEDRPSDPFEQIDPLDERDDPRLGLGVVNAKSEDVRGWDQEVIEDLGRGPVLVLGQTLDDLGHPPRVVRQVGVQGDEQLVEVRARAIVHSRFPVPGRYAHPPEAAA